MRNKYKFLNGDDVSYYSGQWWNLHADLLVKDRLPTVALCELHVLDEYAHRRKAVFRQQAAALRR